MAKIKSLFKFVFLNFGPLLVFYSTHRFYGLKAAVIASFAWVLAEVIIYRLKKKPLTTFFKFSAGIALVFGVVDIYLQESFLFKYEASVTNFLTGIFFIATLWGKTPLILDFAKAQGRAEGELTPERLLLFQFLTIVWAIYFWLKAIFYIWVAQKYTLEESVAIRFLVGNASFYVMLFLSIFCARPIKAVLVKCFRSKSVSE